MANSYLDVSKAAQEQILAAVKQTQEFALAGVELLVKNAPAIPVPAAAGNVPAPEQLLANSFGFAESLLKQQKEFAQKVVAAAAPAFAQAPAASSKG